MKPLPATQPFDLLIRNGHVIDPASGLSARADVGVRDGLIAAVGPDLPPDGCPEVHDAEGGYVSPGWIDLHGHWYEACLFGINAEIGLNQGVTTAVDAGTAGFANFPNFHQTAILTNRARILAFVHVSCMGLHTPFAGELLDLNYARPEETAMVIDAYRDAAVGVKVRIGSMTGNQGNRALDLALEAAKAAQAPLMTHIGEGADEPYILDNLRPGDILTHCFHGNRNGMLSDDPEVGLIPSVIRARERGVIFDVGHGCGSFSWDSARRCFEHHFWPDAISTDLHRYSVDKPWNVNMPQLMSKFLSLGMSIEDVVEKTTAAPARILGRLDTIGSLAPGSAADIVVFRLREGDFEFTDVKLNVNRGDRLIEPQLVVKAGEAFRPGEIPCRLRPLYPCDELIFDIVGVRR